ICPCPAWHTCPPPPLPAPQLPEFEQRVAVLQQLGYLAEDRSVTLKGRVCCEIQSTQDELVATEAVFSGLLGELSPEEAVALLSALVFQVMGPGGSADGKSARQASKKELPD
ncbi:hypothetical protein Vretimale_6108, partial [Volvox reticuliferus]